MVFVVFLSSVLFPQMEDKFERTYSHPDPAGLSQDVLMFWIRPYTRLCGCDIILRVQKGNTCLSWAAAGWRRGGISQWGCVCLCVCVRVAGVQLQRNVHKLITNSSLKEIFRRAAATAAHLHGTAVRADFKSQAVTLQRNPLKMSALRCFHSFQQEPVCIFMKI